MTQGGHRPVLLEAALDALAIREDGFYVDATFGRGGHSGAILRQLGARGRLLAMDQDAEAIVWGRKRFADEPRLRLAHDNFSRLAQAVESEGMAGRVNGILMDLGVSSPQLDEAARGFSFLRSGPLDMRMDAGRGESAAQWLARVDERDLRHVLRVYGEERFAKRIAAAIVAARGRAPIETTGQLAAIISEAVPVKEKNKHPATRSFQAIRIFINRELEVLEQALAASLPLLAPGGRLAVISFHSLEDRIVKRFMRQAASPQKLPPGLPVRAVDIAPDFRLVGKPVVAGADELEQNPRARSARLRVLERLARSGRNGEG